MFSAPTFDHSDFTTALFLFALNNFTSYRSHTLRVTVTKYPFDTGKMTDDPFFIFRPPDMARTFTIPICWHNSSAFMLRPGGSAAKMCAAANA